MPKPRTNGSSGSGQGLSRRQRISHSSEFDETYAQGRKYVGRFMVLWVRSGENASLRLGVVTSRKVGDAPDRTRARRLLREAYRRSRARLSGPFDVVLVGRATIVTAKWGEIVEELMVLANRAGLCEVS